MRYINDLSWITQGLAAVLAGLPRWVPFFVVAIVSCIGLLVFLIIGIMAVIWIERKFMSRLQVRYGPNRVARWWFIRCGLLQPIVDAIKVLTKEALTPAAADRWVFWLAPIAIFIPPILVLAVLPFGPNMVYADLNVGVLYFIVIGSLSVPVAFMAGWSSGNKYALLSAMRAVAQMISYEIPMVLSVLGVVMMAGSLQTTDIVNAQIEGRVWFILVQPLGFLIYFIAALAELNRAPMDIIEAESELISGYHIEYSGMKFAVFYLGEYGNAVVISALMSTLFLGGWASLPILSDWVPPWIVLIGKIAFFFCVLVWIRGTLPRLRIDQLMGFAWKFLFPLALINLFITGVEILLAKRLAIVPQIYLPSMVVVNFVLAGILIVIWSRSMFLRWVRA